MFLFYYVWGFLIYLVSLVHPFIEKRFLVKNNPFLMTKRTFKYLSYFERIFLVLFHKKGWFERSFAYLYRLKDIEDCRRKKYPLIYLFHLFLDKSDYQIDNLKFFSNQYNFYTNSPVFNKKLKKIFNVCFNLGNENFLNFLIIQKIFFRKYFNTFSSLYFKKQDTFNLIKLNYVFNVFLIKASHKFIIYDLNNWYDWYGYNFNKNIIKHYKEKVSTNFYATKRRKKDKMIEIRKLAIMVSTYKIRYMKFSRLLKKEFKALLFFRFSFANFFKIKVTDRYFKLLKNYYTVKFNESSITKHINSNNLKNYNFFYLRKNRIFNKGRYSRNRQLYRTGVYWCLWLNIIMVYGLYFMFYRFSFNFGYIWWGVLVLAYSTIFSRIVKYNFFNPFYVWREFLSLQRWYGYILRVMLYNFENYLKRHFLMANLYNHIIRYKDNKISYFYDNYYYHSSKLFFKWLEKKRNMRIVYLWQGMKEIDTSFLRYKTVLHWIKEIYRLFTTW